MIEIDETGRVMMKGLREGVELQTFLDDVWRRRDAKQGTPPPSSKGWPLDKPAQSRVNVAHLPTSVRRK